MRKIEERKLTRSFIDSLNENMHMHSGVSSEENLCYQCNENPCKCIEKCGACYCDPCECPAIGHVSHDDHDHDHSGMSHEPLNYSEDGVINKEDLYNHFDLDNNGVVTTDEYADHIEFHAAHPESLDKYKSLRDSSCSTVPCKTSYDSCGSYCMSDPESMRSMLEPILAATGATCHTSAVQSMLDVLKSLKDCGIM